MKHPDCYHCKRCTPRIGVVIPARNEFRNIANTVRNIINQTLKPVQVIVVDDRSNDGTGFIASSFEGVDVIQFPKDHDNWVIRKELAHVFNHGLDQLSDDLDYVTIVGADEILPLNHFEYITMRMGMDEDLVIASGEIIGEPSNVPRGSGRLVDWNWWKSIGRRYPINYGYESWLIGKAHSMGKTFKVFHEIRSNVQRPTAQNYRAEQYYHRGQAYNALGYNKRFVLGRAALMVLKHHKFMATRKLVSGFLSKDVEPYDEGVRRYYNMLQNRQMSIRNIPWMIGRFKNNWNE